MVSTWIMVALGGALGAMLRHGAGFLALRAWGLGFPYGTLTVNLVGSALIGVAIIALDGVVPQRFAPFIITGFLGGFTTFSAFSLDMMMMIERGQTVLALGYASLSVAGGLMMAVLGMRVARMVLT